MGQQSPYPDPPRTAPQGRPHRPEQRGRGPGRPHPAERTGRPLLSGREVHRAAGSLVRAGLGGDQHPVRVRAAGPQAEAAAQIACLKAGSTGKMEMAELDRILALVKATTGVDFTQYRDSTIGRRVERRAALLAPAGLADYARLLEQEPAEVQALYQDLLINVTSFFRDPEVFEALKRVAFPALLAGTTRSTPIRLWVPGCSTGQEPYSLAIALLEFLEGTANPPPVQIFGSDLADEAVLGQARAGRYPASIADEVSPERLARFFRRDGDDYVVRRALRELCVFARHDLTADPPFSRIDLISCRNVLIYMTPPLQQRVLPVFHYALNQPGFLVLGSSEAVSGSFGDLFELVEIAPKLYRKLDGAGRSVRPQLSEAFFLRHPPAIPAKPAAGPASPPPAPPPAPTGWRRWLQPWTTETPETDRLRQELTAAREFQQSLAEQQDAAIEELRSANEEIL